MTPTAIITTAVRYLAEPFSPEKAAWCRAGGKQLAEWMGWGLRVPTWPAVPWLWIITGTCETFEPFHSIDDLQPVLRRIAERGLFYELSGWLLYLYDLVEVTDWVVNPEVQARSIEIALLAPPFALAAAALATIVEPKGEGK